MGLNFFYNAAVGDNWLISFLPNILISSAYSMPAIQDKESVDKARELL